MISLRICSFFATDITKAGFDVARTGVASVGFIGFPSVGKSTLMSKLTGQHSEGFDVTLLNLPMATDILQPPHMNLRP